MRKLTNKLFISILTVAFAVIALGTTTFAWFTLSNTATVSPFNATVTAGQGIEISLDQTNWYTTLTEAKIEEFLFAAGTGKYASTFKLDLVTSTDGLAFTLMDGATGVNEAAGTHYIKFTLYFRSKDDTNIAPKIYWNNATITSTGKQWTADASFTDAVGATTPSVTAGDANLPRYAANAARISIKGGADNPVIYELAENFDSKGNTVLGQKSKAELEALTAGQKSYNAAKGVVQTVPAGAAIPNTVTDPADLDNNELITLTGAAKNWTGSVSVVIWLEGWDQNAFNAILDDTLSIGLVFKNTNA